jgi:hypothetical protein
LPFFVKKELYHRHHHLATLVSTIYLCNPYPELGYNGSWWNSWNKWLSANSGKLIKSIDYNSLPMIEPAPGSYVK